MLYIAAKIIIILALVSAGFYYFSGNTEDAIFWLLVAIINSLGAIETVLKQEDE